MTRLDRAQFNKWGSMNVEIDEDKLKELTVKCFELGKSMGITPYQFAIMLNMVGKYLSDTQGIHIHAIQNTDRIHENDSSNT